jgi:hypothetical protein
MSLLVLLSVMLFQGSIQPADMPRYILLFGDKAEPGARQQWQLLQKDSSGLKERDVQVKWVPARSSLYRTYTVSARDPFTIILVGRDGQEKYRSSQLTTITHFFALIDAMPMRRAEMRKKKTGEQ